MDLVGALKCLVIVLYLLFTISSLGAVVVFKCTRTNSLLVFLRAIFLFGKSSLNIGDARALQVPKRYFAHFYFTASLVCTLTLFFTVTRPREFPFSYPILLQIRQLLQLFPSLSYPLKLLSAFTRTFVFRFSLTVRCPSAIISLGTSFIYLWHLLFVGAISIQVRLFSLISCLFQPKMSLFYL